MRGPTRKVLWAVQRTEQVTTDIEPFPLSCCFLSHRLLRSKPAPNVMATSTASLLFLRFCVLTGVHLVGRCVVLHLGLSCGCSKVVAGAGTFMMASFLCLMPRWADWEVRRGWNAGTAGPFSFHVVPEPFPLHTAFVCGLSSRAWLLHGAAQISLRGKSGSFLALLRFLKSQNCHGVSFFIILLVNARYSCSLDSRGRNPTKIWVMGAAAHWSTNSLFF